MHAMAYSSTTTGAEPIWPSRRRLLVDVNLTSTQYASLQSSQAAHTSREWMCSGAAHTAAADLILARRPRRQYRLDCPRVICNDAFGLFLMIQQRFLLRAGFLRSTVHPNLSQIRLVSNFDLRINVMNEANPPIRECHLILHTRQNSGALLKNCFRDIPSATCPLRAISPLVTA